jgi:DNA-binding NarL/FixJ family response regulator
MSSLKLPEHQRYLLNVKDVVQQIKVAIITPEYYTKIGISTLLTASKTIDIVFTALNDFSCQELIAKYRPNIILIDPTSSREQICNLISNLKYEYADIKIILLSDITDYNFVINTIHAGADAYCLKKSIMSPRILNDIIECVQAGDTWLDTKTVKPVINGISILKDLYPSLNSANRYNLTDREVNVLALLVKGYMNQEIADSLGLSYHTIKASVTQILQKYNVIDRTQLVIKVLSESANKAN